MPWYAWIGVSVVALIGELLSNGLYVGSFAIAALTVSALSLFLPLSAQLVVFVLLSVVFVAFVRPSLRPLLRTTRSGQDVPRVGPLDDRATAVGVIDHLQGQIRVGSGEFWSARTLEPGENVHPGEEVEIVRMEGLTARVRSLEPTMARPTVSSSEFGLSPREVEVLRLLARGLSNQEIADRLFLSPRTVHHHVSHILDKMGVDNRVEAVRIAFETGLVENPRGQS
jgi:DNA-binding CsgD family transcriptional regulator/membrane protein implicated in regulation of membrane protease activity